MSTNANEWAYISGGPTHDCSVQISPDNKTFIVREYESSKEGVKRSVRVLDISEKGTAECLNLKDNKFIHKVKVDDNREDEIEISCIDGYWKAKSVHTAWRHIGGVYRDAEEYIKYMEIAYRFHYDRNMYGYKYASERLDKSLLNGHRVVPLKGNSKEY